jgi:acetyl-CoA synthetase
MMKQYNIGYHCTTLQCELGRGKKTAMRWIAADGSMSDYTFAMLDENSNAMANILAESGLGAGDIVFTFLPKMPEQFFAFLGILKLQAVAGTLFSNFGDEALIDRLGDSRAKAVVTKASLLKKVLRAKTRLPGLKIIFVVDIPEDKAEDVISLPKRMAAASRSFDTPLTAPETPSVLHYTSGSTGKPKGVQHVHQSLLLQQSTCVKILGLREDDLYWCTADQGWVTGTTYGIIGPWSLGITQLHYGGTYDAAVWMRLLEREKVNVWYTAPTALRMLMREDPSMFRTLNLPALRNIFSVGEPLNPEINYWGREMFHKEIYDTWFQTETGSIMICNRPGMPVKPGSMGRPIDEMEAAILTDEGAPCPEQASGNLCLKAPWDSMFRSYLNNQDVYDGRFRKGYYFSGDLAKKDQDGYYWFIGRNDDVINTAGHLISPFEIESALLELPEIAESAVIGAPDELLFEKVVAFVRLKSGYLWNEDIEMNIRLHLSNRLSTIATPQDIRPVDEIPKNRSGKIMRRVLRALYLGEDPGDISTLDI